MTDSKHYYFSYFSSGVVSRIGFIKVGVDCLNASTVDDINISINFVTFQFMLPAISDTETQPQGNFRQIWRIYMRWSFLKKKSIGFPPLNFYD